MTADDFIESETADDIVESEEVWYPIPSLPGYELSSELRVRSWWGRGSRWGHAVLVDKPKILSVYLSNYGYLRFRIGIKGKKYEPAIHCIVAELAYGVTPDPTRKNHIRHFDGDRLNNYASNIAIGTAKDNTDDAIRHGTVRSWAKLDEHQVREIRSKIASGMNDYSLATEYGVIPQSIYRIRKKICWADVQ